MSEDEDLAKSWKSQRGAVIELPSGNKARVVRSLDLRTAIKAGTIPNPLRDVVSKMLDTQANKMPPKALQDPEVLQQLMDLMQKTVVQAMVAPKVAIPPDDANPATWVPEDEGTISIWDMSEQDRLYVYSIAQGGEIDLDKFRKQQEQLMAAVVNGKEVPDTAKRAPRANGSKRRSPGVVSR